MTRSRSDTLRLLNRIPATKVKEPKSQGEWSVKDVIAHIVAWENDGRRRLELIRKGKADQIHFYDSLREANDFNARSVKKYRSYSLTALLKEAAAVRKKLIAELRELPEEDLNHPAHAYTVMEWLPEYAWDHESDHRARIRAWLGKSS